MTWLVLAGATAFFYGVQGAWSKFLTGRVSQLAAAWALFAFAFPLLAFYLLAVGPPATVGAAFWPALGTNVGLSVLSFYLYVSALHYGDLGLTYPLLALTPLFLIPVEWLLLGDVPGLAGLAGILLVVAGVYLLNFSAREASLLAPFAAVLRDRGARRMLGVALIWAVSGVVDRVAVTNASTPFYGTLLTGGLTVAFLPLVSWKGGGVRRAVAPGSRILLVGQGLLFGLMFICQMEALRQTLAAYVITVKRSGALVSVLLGAALFREGGLRQRLFGTAIIVAGVALLAIG